MVTQLRDDTKKNSMEKDKEESKKLDIEDKAIIIKNEGWYKILNLIT